MKILVVCQHYWPENFRVTEICETLVEQGHQVTALVGLPNYPTGNIPKEYRYFRNRKQHRNGVEIRRCFEIGRRQSKIGLAVNYMSYMVSACIKGLFLRHDYDVIYSFSTSPVLMSYPGVWLKKFFRKKFCLYILDIWPACLAAMNVSENAPLYRIMKKVSRHIYCNADCLLYSSYPFREYLKNVHGIDVPEENYLPQFADDVTLQGSSLNKLKENDSDKTLQLVFTGNIGKVQAIDTLVQAAALLREQDIRWHIVGDGAAYAQMKEMTDQLHLDHCVRFYGRRPLSEMPQFFDLADALIVSMKYDALMNDTLPGKVQSYMASGKPIIAPIAGEAARVVKEAGAGLTCEPENPEALAETIMNFKALSCDERSGMGSNAYSYYEQTFSKKVHMQHLTDCITQLVNGE